MYEENLLLRFLNLGVSENIDILVRDLDWDILVGVEVFDLDRDEVDN